MTGDRLTALGRLNSEMSEIWNTAKETKAKIAESRNVDLASCTVTAMSWRS